MNKKITLLFFTAFAIALFACNKAIEYPNEPVLTFNTFTFSQDTDAITKTVTKSVKIVLNFTDGDGDLGLKAGLAEDPNKNGNAFYKSTYKKNGVWTEFVDFNGKEIGYFPAIIPTLNKSNKSKPLKGYINIDVTSNLIFNSVKDTMRIEVYVVDNAGNKSNVITTPETKGLQQ